MISIGLTMDIVLISLFIATILPIVAKAPLALQMAKEGKGRYDNRYPREQQERIKSGFGARCKAAHYNSFEALTMYAPGALAIIFVDAANTTTEYCAMAFVFARICYLFMYWMDINILRSVFWFIGFMMPLVMLWQAMSAVAVF